jgi:hypothetical protein
MHRLRVIHPLPPARNEKFWVRTSLFRKKGPAVCGYWYRLTVTLFGSILPQHEKVTYASYSIRRFCQDNYMHNTVATVMPHVKITSS